MKEKISKRRLFLSAGLFLLCYALTLLLVFLMIIINQPTEWTSYFKEKYFSAVLVCVCIFLLFAIIYYYYFFEDKSFLMQPKKTMLVLSVMMLALVFNYALGRVSGYIYCAPSPCLPSCSYSF